MKINIGTKNGKTYKIELDSSVFEGIELGQTIKGEEFYPELAGYELQIMGASDSSGFPSIEGVDGVALKKVLLTYGKGMKKRTKKEGKKKRSKNRPKGLRLRKTVRGKILSKDTAQINLKVLKEGGKKLSDIFPDQNKPKEVAQAKKSE